MLAHHLTFSARLITVTFVISYLCVHAKIEGKPVSIFGVWLRVLLYNFNNLSILEGAHFTPVTPGTWVNFMLKESIWNSGVNGANSLMESFLRGSKHEKTERIERCQEREKHVLGLIPGNWAEPLMEDRRPEAKLTDSLTYAICHISMFPHQQEVTK